LDSTKGNKKMKKLAIIAILSAFTGVASAADVGLRVGTDLSNTTNSVGLTVDQKLGDFGVEGDFDRSIRNHASDDRVSLLGTYDFAKISDLTFTAKAGAALVDPSNHANGYALLGGVGVSYPITKSVSLTADYLYQDSQSRVHTFDGNRVSVGFKVPF